MKSDYYVVKFWQKSEHFYFFGTERVKVCFYTRTSTRTFTNRGNERKLAMLSDVKKNKF